MGGGTGWGSDKKAGHHTALKESYKRELIRQEVRILKEFLTNLRTALHPLHGPARYDHLAGSLRRYIPARQVVCDPIPHH